MSDVLFQNQICVRVLKWFAGSLSEMAVLGVGRSVGILGALIISTYSLNMVLVGKDPMYCLSGKLRFVSQLLSFGGKFLRELLFSVRRFLQWSSSRFNVVFSYVPVSLNLFLDRL